MVSFDHGRHVDEGCLHTFEYGFSKLAYRNVGKMRNLGWEFNITTNRIIKAGKFSADFNVAFGNNKNEILEMDATVLNMLNTKFTQENRNVLQRVQLNNPFGAIYGFRYKGVYQYHYETFADMGWPNKNSSWQTERRLRWF